MNVETLAERREREVSCFNELPVFPEGCTSWEEFLQSCNRRGGEPFMITLQRSYGAATKSIEDYYFFGVTHVPEDFLSFGRKCFTPLNFSTRTATALDFLKQEDLGLLPELPYQGKIAAISFDPELFGENLLEKSLFLKSGLLMYPGNYTYVATMLGYLSHLRGALSHGISQKFDNEIQKIETRLHRASQ